MAGWLAGWLTSRWKSGKKNKKEKRERNFSPFYLSVPNYVASYRLYVLKIDKDREEDFTRKHDAATAGDLCSIGGE